MGTEVFILTLIILLIVIWAIDRICKAAENVGMYKVMSEIVAKVNSGYSGNKQPKTIMEELKEAIGMVEKTEKSEDRK